MLLALIAFAACDNSDGESEAIIVGFPVTDFVNIDGLTQFWDGDPKPVEITVKEEKGISGVITVYYNGALTPPARPGRYTVTFDIDAPGSRQKRIAAGILTITLCTDNATVLRTQLLYCPKNTIDNPIPVKLDIDLRRFVTFINTLAATDRYIELDLADSIGTTITGQPFSNVDYSKIVSLVLPTGLINIGDFGLAYFSGLVNINLPVELNTLEDYAFFNCSNLRSVNMSADITRLGDYVFFNCGSLNNVAIPDTVLSIGAWAFVNCAGLTSIKIGKNVAFIGRQAFHDTGLTSVTFTSIVENFGGSTFTFPGDLQEEYLEGGPGTYIRHDVNSETWKKL
jgi:hypothetical protein